MIILPLHEAPCLEHLFLYIFGVKKLEPSLLLVDDDDDDDDDDNNNNNNNNNYYYYYLLQLGCLPVAVAILHVNKT